MSSRLSVLVVEDHQDLRDFYSLALRLEGFTVREAADGWEALRMIDSQPPDVLVLDLMMPGLNGLSVQREIAAQAATRDIPIVIVTASDWQVRGVNVACVLRKPIDPDTLVIAVRGCIGRVLPRSEPS